MGFMEGVSRAVYGVVLLLFLLALLPFMYYAIQSQLADPTIQAAGLFMILVFSVGVVYVAFFKKDEMKYPIIGR